MRELIGVVVVYSLLLLFTFLLVPYLYLHALRAAMWYGTPGVIVLSIGMAACLVGSLLAWRRMR